ncbi:MAG TPA: hypothetical protein VJP79_00030 [Nitrososphaera sp.]|nr:hypothetical protein [Nitrososphaera sp.]
MLGDSHLHIGRQDPIGKWVAAAMGMPSRGSIHISVDDTRAVSITAEGGGLVAVDLIEPAVFRLSQDETGLFEKLKTATELGRKLSDRGVTVQFMRKGKEAVRLGKGAHPTLSKVLTRSSDVQLSSVRQFAKLKGDLKAD